MDYILGLHLKPVWLLGLHEVRKFSVTNAVTLGFMISSDDYVIQLKLRVLWFSYMNTLVMTIRKRKERGLC